MLTEHSFDYPEAMVRHIRDRGLPVPVYPCGGCEPGKILFFFNGHIDSACLMVHPTEVKQAEYWQLKLITAKE